MTESTSTVVTWPIDAESITLVEQRVSDLVPGNTITWRPETGDHTNQSRPRLEMAVVKGQTGNYLMILTVFKPVSEVFGQPSSPMPLLEHASGGSLLAAYRNIPPEIRTALSQYGINLPEL